MTLPDERYRAVLIAKSFLEDLCNTATTPRVPKAIRGRAYSILRHFPNSWDLDRASIGAPDVFQKQMEPVQRLIMQYEEGKNEEKL